MSKALKDLIQELVMEHVIEEKFGQKIGQQPSLVGVRDERNLAEDELEEMYPGADIDLGEGEDELEEVAPPGREKQVKALKKKPGIDNPWAVAWASYNKG